MDRDEIQLNEESLVYYKNIEFLKEITKQATALMSRSNSIYRNILNEPKHKMTIQSASTASVPSHKPGPTLCPTCGASHKVDFCILQEIVNEEQRQKMKEEFSLKADEPAVPLISKKRGKIAVDKVTSELPLFRKQLSTEELESYHKLISARYGRTAGDRYLLARSLISSKKDEKTDEAAIEPPTFSSKSGIEEARDGENYECGTKTSILMSTLCPEYSSTTLEKMSKLLHLRPPCVNERPPVERNWKLMFERSRFLKESEQVATEQEKVQVETSVQDDLEVCTCQRFECNCEPGEICVEPPSKKACCELIENTAVNNYLATLRIAKRQDHHHYEQIEFDTVTESIAKDGVDLEALHSHMHAEKINSLGKCLEGCRPENNNPEEAHNFKNDLQLIIKNDGRPDEDQWHRWIDHYKLRKIEDSIIADSLDGSSIPTNDSQRSLMFEDDHLDVKEKSILHPTRIPYANEVFRLTNDRFGKIMSKFNKIILAMMSVEERISLWPKLSHLVQKISLRKPDDPISSEILQIFSSSGPKSKTFVPRYAKQCLYSKKSKKLSQTINRIRTSRKHCKQLLLGGETKRANRLSKYTAKRNYIGFTPYQRQLLKKPELERFKTCDLVGNDQGRTITKAVIHRDYQFLKILMDTSPENMRKNLFDSGLEERYLKFKKTLQQADSNIVANEIPEQDVLSKSKKDESVLLGSVKDKMNNRNCSSWSDFVTDAESRLKRGLDLSKRNPITSNNIDTKSRLARMQSDTMRAKSDTRSTNKRTNQGGREEPLAIRRNYDLNRSQDRNSLLRTTGSSSSIKANRRYPEKSQIRSQSQAKLESQLSPRKPAEKSDLKERKKSVASGNTKFKDQDEPYFSSFKHQPESKGVSKLLQTDFDTTVSEFLKLSSSNAKRHLGNIPKDVGPVPTDIFAYPIIEDVQQKQEDPVTHASSGAIRVPASSASRVTAEQLPGHGNVTLKAPSDEKLASLQFLSHAAKNMSQAQSAASSPESSRLSHHKDFQSRQSQISHGQLAASGGSDRQTEAQRRLIDEKVRKLRGSSANSDAYKDGFLSETSGGLPPGAAMNISKQSVNEPHLKSALNKRYGSKTEMPVKILKHQLETSSGHSKQTLSLDSSSAQLAPGSAHGGSGIIRDITFGEKPSLKSVSISKEIIESTQPNKLKDRRPTKFQAAVKSDSSQSVITSMPKASKGLPVSRSFSQLFPGKKVVFGLDVGQGLRNVKFVKDNAQGADEMKKQEMVKLLTGAKEKAIPKPAALSSEQSFAKSSASITLSEQVSQHQFLPRSAEPAKRHAPFEYQIDADSPLQQQQRRVKTLDEIYKEAHGINKNNTPSLLVENSYEFETTKKQQLRKHREER